MSALKVAVVIPFYKKQISVYEKISLTQCFSVLQNYDIIGVKPLALVLQPDVNEQPFSEIISFDDNYFENIQGYNRLMLSPFFYERFASYNYILIYQLDAFVFEDKLGYWCRQGFDYVGAPWIRAERYSNYFSNAIAKAKNYFYRRYNIKDKHGTPKIRKQSEGQVGNGGFSLRKVDTFIKYSNQFVELIAYYNQMNESWFNEDIFWSIEVNRKKKVLNIPDEKIGLRFAFELYPERAFVINNNKLPFGCHAWDKNIEFWKPIFAGLGYTI